MEQKENEVIAFIKKERIVCCLIVGNDFLIFYKTICKLYHVFGL